MKAGPGVVVEGAADSLEDCELVAVVDTELDVDEMGGSKPKRAAHSETDRV